ncbi:hypothetical protein [Salinarimonas soli]|uniref:Uncharacterized protein n=1 Tax=Salinarimonas soli TaxID=1638099 RepID=A0A5B2VCK9_9HYPH|nr:hypothetical protein [Salinarimonas soli]KAA2235877.1 hypothetical protein F0L46_17715 [Salinarimonas soli]
MLESGKPDSILASESQVRMTTVEQVLAPQTSLHRNPFRLIGATTRDNRTRIIELADEAGLIRDADDCRDAQGALMSPRRRLTAEMAWLPGVAPSKASQLVDDISTAAVRETAGELPPLARANVLASFIEALSGSITAAEAATAITRLAIAVEAIDLEDVFRDINEERAVAGFTPERDLDAVAEEFEVRKRAYKSCATALLERFPAQSVVKIVDAVAARSTKDGSKPAPALIQDLVEGYELNAQSFIEREAENIEKLATRARELGATGESAVLPVVEEMKQVAENYLSVARPILIVNKPIGLTHRPSRDIAFEMRGLAVNLHNDYGFIDAPARLTTFLKERFAIVDDIAERVSEDDAFLKDAVEQRRQSELSRQEFEREITYSAEVGLIFKDSISISPKGVSWKGQHIPLEEITRIRWGATRHSINGIPTGTDLMIMVGDARRTINISMRNKDVYANTVDRLWKAAGVPILIQIVAQLRNGNSIAFGDAIIRDNSVSLIRHRVFGANERVDLSWSDVNVWSQNGEFVLGARNDKKVYVSLSYQSYDNVHVLEHLIRMFFKKPVARISQILD